MIWKMTERKKEDMSARKLRVRQVTSMNARITENKGRPQNKAMLVLEEAWCTLQSNCRYKSRIMVSTVLFRKGRLETEGLGGSFYKL